MISFESDYNNGAHPQIIRRLSETNSETAPGYGADRFCESAKEKICRAIGKDNLQVEFLVGGTQTNAIVISTMLSDNEGVLSAKTGHINLHEGGAIEYTGHKVTELEQKNGKILIPELKKYLENFFADENHEHMVAPGMVYISHPTEYGTLYTKEELTCISKICREYGISLFLDGARLGYGLLSRETDVSLKDIAELCDVFYIGGTKVGALCGEAVVFTRNNKPKHFLTSIKKRGALLANGRLLGIQFDTLYTDHLYCVICKNAIDKAETLKELFRSRGFKFFIDSPTNQQFVILDNTVMKKLGEKVSFSYWEKYDENSTVVRFATSWATTDDDLKSLSEILDEVI